MSTSSVPPEQAARPRSPRRRRLIACLLLALLAVLVAGFVLLEWQGQRAMQEATAEADRLDPGWRLAELDEKRPRLADENNSATRVLAVYRLLHAAGWRPADDRVLAGLKPQVQLSGSERTALQASPAKAAGARDEARRLADMPDGYIAVNWAPDVWNTRLVPGQQELRDVVYLLRDDALARAQEGDVDGALRSLQASVNAARCVGDVPWLMAQLLRSAFVTPGALTVERVLAQGEPSPPALAALQHLLEEEDRHPYDLLMARGERAGLHQHLTWLESGNGDVWQEFGQTEGGLSRPGRRWLLLLPGGLRRQHAALLHDMNRLVEAAKLPESERKKQFDEVAAAAERQQGALSPLPLLVRYADGFRDTHARLRCAAVLLAAERYRRERGHWPDSVEDLVSAGYMQAVPADPHDGQPLRLTRSAEGLVVYSVGGDSANPGRPTGLGLRLWDVDKRRQPARAVGSAPTGTR